MRTPKGTDTLAYKQGILNGLVTRMQFNRAALNPKEQEKIRIIEIEVEQALKALLEKMQHEEINIKIDGAKRVLAIAEKHD